MILVGTLEQLELANILQELHAKTGLLAIKHGEQRVKLYLKQGLIMCIDSRQGHTTLENGHAHFNGHAHIKFSSQNDLQEATRIIQDLLTWSTGEVYFEDEVQPPTDRSPLALHISSLVPSPINLASTPILFTRDPKTAVEATDSPITPLPPVEEDDLLTQFPTLTHHLSNSPPVVEAKNGPVTILPAIADTPTVVQQTVILPGRADTIIPDALTAEIPIFKSGQRQFAGLRWEVVLIVAILLVAALAHGINMFHFPYLEDDEGTYMSQAWAVVHEGRLAYYTYWYDHAPAGWILIAIWTLLSGGFHTFGSVINSGRVLMLIMQVASTFMVYRIARNLSNKVSVAVIASLLFALTPYGLYFHRRVLLDNITTFWMLLSILLLLSRRLSLKRIWLSALALGLSILSKELTVFLVPILMYLVYFRADKSHRWLATVVWVVLVVSLVSFYPLMALLNNELFPTGTLLGGTAPHVSLLTSLQYQASRGTDYGIFNLNSGFWFVTTKWMQDEPMLVITGSVCAVLSVLTIKKHRLSGVMGLVTLSLWAFMARGGEVLGFYLVPLLPLLAINIGIVFGSAADKLKTYAEKLTRGDRVVGRALQLMLVLQCLFGIIGGYLSPNLGFQSNILVLWNSTQADAQNQASEWIENNLPYSSTIIIDMYMWPDLYDSGYTRAHYYWKVEADPAIRDNVFHNDWRTADYIVTTDQMLNDIQVQHMELLQEVLAHSTLIAHFDTGGWPIDIRRVNKPNHAFSLPSNRYLLVSALSGLGGNIVMKT